MLNKVCDRKQTFFDYKDQFFQSPKNRVFQKRLTHAFGQKKFFFLYLFSVKKGLEIRFNNVLGRKETFFDHKNKIFQRLKNIIFSKGVNPCFRSKNDKFFCI